MQERSEKVQREEFAREEYKKYDNRQYMQERMAEGMTGGIMCKEYGRGSILQTGVWRV